MFARCGFKDTVSRTDAGTLNPRFPLTHLNVEATVSRTNETEPHVYWSWNARSGKYPDQYTIDRMLEINPNVVHRWRREFRTAPGARLAPAICYTGSSPYDFCDTIASRHGDQVEQRTLLGL